MVFCSKKWHSIPFPFVSADQVWRLIAGMRFARVHTPGALLLALAD